MDKNRIIAASILAAGIVVCGVLLTCALDHFTYRDRCVTVKGLSVKEFPADKVVCPLVFKEIGDNLQDLYTNINAKNKIITDFVESYGIAASDISIAAPEIVDLQAERYLSERPPYRYNVTSVVTISSSDVDKVKHLMAQQSELLKKGVALVAGDYRYNVTYDFTGLNDVKPAMIEEATKNARAAAEKFAADSDSKLGRIRRASQGQCSITDRDANTPDIKTVRVVTTVEYYLED